MRRGAWWWKNNRPRGMPPKIVVVLLSGGLDSATVLAIARSEGHECYAISFNYGQRHVYELECARKVARARRRLG